MQPHGRKIVLNWKFQFGEEAAELSEAGLGGDEHLRLSYAAGWAVQQLCLWRQRKQEQTGNRPWALVLNCVYTAPWERSGGRK